MNLKTIKLFTCLWCCICFAQISFGQTENNGSAVHDTADLPKLPEALKSASLKSELEGATEASNLLKKNKAALDSVINLKKTLQEKLSSKVNLFSKTKAIKINKINLDGDLSYSGDTSMKNLMPYQPQSTWTFSTGFDLSVFNLPFVFNYQGSNGVYTMGHIPFSSFDQFNFDPVKYREHLKALVLQNIKPDVVLASIMNRINQIRATYEASLKKEISEVAKQYREQYQQELKLPEGITNLNINDLSSLKTKLLSGTNADQYRENITRAQELLNTGTLPGSIADSNRQMLMAEVKKVEVLQSIYKKILSAKSRFEDNKIVKELRSHLPFTPDQYASFLQNPGNLMKVIHDYANLSSLQSLFLNITKLDLGKNAVNRGSLSMKNVVNNGINTAFKNEKLGLGVIYGTNANTNNWLQSGLSSFVSNEYSHMYGITLSNRYKSSMHQTISMNFFDFRNDPQLSNSGELVQSSYLAQGQRKDAVMTVHSGWPIDAKSKVSIDLSRSFGSYNQFSSLDSSAHKPEVTKSLFSSQGTDNYAASIDFDGEVRQTPVQFHFSKTGLGYNNPGNVYLRRGEIQVGGNIKRKLLKQKLSLQYSVDYRNQAFDPEGIYTFHTFSNKFKASYRMNRYTDVGINFSNSNYASIHQNGQSVGGINRRFELQGTYRFKVCDQVITSNDNISHQLMNVPDITGANYKSQSFLFVHSSSMILKNNLLSLAFTGNKSNNDSYYFNTSFFNADLNYSYAIGKAVRLSSGAGYYDNSGWNRQVGMSQQVNLSLGRLNFNLDANYRKAIYVVRKDLANILYLTTSLHYQFN